MTEALRVLEDHQDEETKEPHLRLLPSLSELLDQQDNLGNGEADIATARRLQAAITLKQLLNQLAAFREAKDTIHELLGAAVEDDDDSQELARLMAQQAVEDAIHADDMHDIMDMAEAKAIRDLDADIARGVERHSTAPLEVLQARFYASYRERTGADLYAPGETI